MYSARGLTHVNTQCANGAVSWEFDGTHIRFLELGDLLIRWPARCLEKGLFQGGNRMELCHLLLQAFKAVQDHRRMLNLGWGGGSNTKFLRQ